MSVEFFPLSRIRLTTGMFADRQRTHARHLMAIDPDRLLAPFLKQAGLPEQAGRYGGWESRDISGHSLGHYLSALAGLHAASGDLEAFARVNHIVGALARCQEANADGYVLPVEKSAIEAVRKGDIQATPFSLNGVWVPFYTLHKLLAGLRDAYRWCGNHQALQVAKSVCDWLEGILRELDDPQIQQMLSTEHGGMNEVLADLTSDTGESRYLELASRCFHHGKVLEPMFCGEDRLNGLHGNTQIPKVVGLAREFELNPDPRYRVAAESFWDHVVNHRSYVIGGHGESEHFFPHEQFPQRLTPNTCETCNTYNLLKLTKHLFTWRPDAARMDFVERAMINHLAANIGREPGEFGYFLGLGSVGVKVFSTPFDSWWCCVGTGLENPVRYGEQVYARDNISLWVNLFVGSRLEWPERNLTLVQNTCFPDEDHTRIFIKCAEPVRVALRIRHPYWCASPCLKLNGEPVAVNSAPSSYLSIDRVWSDGDVIELHLPMSLRHELLPHSDGNVLAMMFGPVVLAAVVPDGEGITNPSGERFTEHLAARGKTDAFPPHLVASGPAAVVSGLRSTGNFAEFRSEGIVRPDDLTFMPLHRIYQEQYAVYFPLLGPEEWKLREGQIREEREASRIIEAGTVDHVTPGYQQPEVEHKLACENSGIEDFSDRKCRVASDGGWFFYQMKVEPAGEMVLAVTYWGGVWHERNFDILVDDVPLASQTLLANRPGDFFDCYHDLPGLSTAGKSRVTVRFQSRAGDIAGGVFDLRTMRASAVPARRYEQVIVFKDH